MARFVLMHLLVRDRQNRPATSAYVVPLMLAGVGAVFWAIALADVFQRDDS